MAESDPKPSAEEHSVREYLGAGEMVPKRTLDKVLDSHINALSGKTGIIIDGYPRDIDQATFFEQRVSLIF